MNGRYGKKVLGVIENRAVGTDELGPGVGDLPNRDSAAREPGAVALDPPRRSRTRRGREHFPQARTALPRGRRGGGAEGDGAAASLVPSALSSGLFWQAQRSRATAKASQTGADR